MSNIGKEPVDLAARNRMANALTDFLNGRIRNIELDDIIFRQGKADEMCLELGRQVWLFYDDIISYKNEGKYKLSSENEGIIRRWIALLQSTAEWRVVAQLPNQSRLRRVLRWRLTPKPNFRNNPYWPLKDIDAWQRFGVRA